MATSHYPLGVVVAIQSPKESLELSLYPTYSYMGTALSQGNCSLIVLPKQSAPSIIPLFYHFSLELHATPLVVEGRFGYFYATLGSTGKNPYALIDVFVLQGVHVGTMVSGTP